MKTRKPDRKKPLVRRRTLRKRGRPMLGSKQSVGSDAIVATTCDLLRDRDPANVNLTDVARVLGVDRSLIRYYYRNRDTLMLAVARHLFDRMRAAMAASRAVKAGDPEGEIRQTVRALLKFQVEHPYFRRLVSEEVARSTTEDARAFFREFVESGLGFVARVSKQGRAEGRFRKFQAQFLYMALVGLCDFFATGLPYLQVAFGASATPRALLPQFEVFLSRYVIDGIRSGKPRRRSGGSRVP